MTLIEVLIATLISAIVITTATGLYLLNQKVWQTGKNNSELLQNARVIVDRLSRELRQANEIIPQQNKDILFEDGHNSELDYIKYYIKADFSLNRQKIIYYLPGSPGVSVRWDVPEALPRVETDELIAKNINSLTLSLETVPSLILNLGQKTFTTKIYPRNTR